MKLTQYQKLQIISLAVAVQEIIKIDGQDVTYVTEQQSSDFGKLINGQVAKSDDEKNQSIREIVEMIHRDLMDPPKTGTFELYDKMQESIKSFDWAAHHVSKDEPEKKG